MFLRFSHTRDSHFLQLRISNNRLRETKYIGNKNKKQAHHIIDNITAIDWEKNGERGGAYSRIKF